MQTGFEIKEGTVEVGNTYCLYGMITKIIAAVPGAVVVEINNSIIAKMAIPEESKIELLKERSFEPGIFVSKIIAKHPKTEVEVSTVIFGERSHKHTI